jgi:hypothetical protein
MDQLQIHLTHKVSTTRLNVAEICVKSIDTVDKTQFVIPGLQVHLSLAPSGTQSNRSTCQARAKNAKVQLQMKRDHMPLFTLLYSAAHAKQENNGVNVHENQLAG